MILATTSIEEFDRFLETFTTVGADKRRHHGSKGSIAFRDPNDPGRMWVVFDWDEDGFQRFASDPETPAILQAAGAKGRPQLAELVGRFDA